MFRFALLTGVFLCALSVVSSAHANGFTTIECGHAKYKQVDPLLSYSASNPTSRPRTCMSSSVTTR